MTGPKPMHEHYARWVAEVLLPPDGTDGVKALYAAASYAGAFGFPGTATDEDFATLAAPLCTDPGLRAALLARVKQIRYSSFEFRRQMTGLRAHPPTPETQERY